MIIGSKNGLITGSIFRLTETKYKNNCNYNIPRLSLLNTSPVSAMTKKDIDQASDVTLRNLSQAGIILSQTLK